MKPDCSEVTVPKRILIVSDSHPELKPGLSQIASGELFNYLSDVEDVEAFFLVVDRQIPGQSLRISVFQPFGDRKYLVMAHGFDAFLGSNGDADFPQRFEDVLRRIEPDLIHFRSLDPIGVEAITHARRTCQQGGIVVTLCPLSLAMPPRTNGVFCSDRAINEYFEANFPQKNRNDMLLRELYMRRFFNDVDAFIVSDTFTEKNSMIADLLSERVHFQNEGANPALSGEFCGPNPRELIVGVFGAELSSAGLGILQRTVEILATSLQMPVRFRFEVHVAEASEPSGDFERWLERHPSVKIRSIRHASEISELMLGAHLVLIPDAICKDAPYLVQIARAMRRPVICPDRGNVAALVAPTIDGFHFSRSNAAALAGLLTDIALEPELIDRVRETMSAASTFGDVAEATLAVYRRVATRLHQLIAAEG